MKIILHQVACLFCKSPYPDDEVVYRCPKCGGIYGYLTAPEFSLSLIDSSVRGVWRYRRAIGLPDGIDIISLGEGNTPLIWDDFDGQKVGFKLEYLNPTGSF